MRETCSAYGGQERFIQDFGGETRGKSLLVRPRRRWEDNIKMDLQEVGWANWIDLPQDMESWRAILKTVMYLWLP